NTGGTIINTSNVDHSIYVQGRYAYIIDRDAPALDIVDISDPTSTTGPLSTVSANLSTPQFVTVQGRYAYISNSGNNTTAVYDISNPAAPVAVDTIPSCNQPWSNEDNGR